MVCINLAHDGYINGLDGDKAVMESWARGVEVLMTNERYRRIGNPNHDYKDGYQRQSIQEEREYTSIVIDMMDNENQRVTRTSPRGPLPQDRVSGYTILQIQQGLRGVKAWYQWRDNMRGISNPTSNNINELFGNWH